MTNKESITDQPTHLATRLQAAKTEGVTALWLAVRSGQRNLLFRLAQAGEIISMASIAPVPHTLEWFVGVVNLRGGLYGVVDLAGFMGDKPANARTAQPTAVTFNPDLELNCALIVDGLAGLRREDSFVSSEVAPVDAPMYFGPLLTDSKGEQWQEINLHLLSQCPEFLRISV